MEETEETKKEETKKLSKVEEAKQIVERQEAANAEHARLLEREEALHAEKLISGEINAGQPIKSQEELEQEKPQKLADEITNAFK